MNLTPTYYDDPDLVRKFGHNTGNNQKAEQRKYIIDRPEIDTGIK